MERREKGNQKGFTLIELLVAIAILAIIAVPLLNAFLMSVRTDAKAKVKMRAATAASNVMEDIKSKSWEKLTEGKSPDASGNYSYSVEESVDYKNFTVEVSISPNQGEAAAYNREELAKLYSIDGVHDGIYVQSQELNRDMAKQLKGDAYQTSDAFSGIRRNMKVDIEKKPNAQGFRVTVNNTYSFAGVSPISDDPEVIYESQSAAYDLNNIYLLYYPMYNSSATSLTETVTIENTDEVPVNCYLVCQNYDASKQNNVRLQLRCLENKRDDYKENCITRICSNLPLTKNGKGLWLTYLQGNAGDTFTDQKWAEASRTNNAKKILDFHGLANEQQSDWVYTVTVKAHEGRPGEDKYDKVLATYTSTIEK